MIALETLKKILSSVTYYSLMIDETTDVSKKEQVSLCLRYADDKTGKIEERLVQMLPVDKADASSLENLVMKFIEKHTKMVKLSENVKAGERKSISRYLKLEKKERI